MVGVSASVNLPLHHKVQKFSSGTGSPGWSRKKGRKMVVVWCGGTVNDIKDVTYVRQYFCASCSNQLHCHGVDCADYNRPTIKTRSTGTQTNSIY